MPRRRALLTSVSHLAGSANSPLFASTHLLLARCKPLAARVVETLPRGVLPSVPSLHTQGSQAVKEQLQGHGLQGLHMLPVNVPAPSVLSPQGLLEERDCTHLASRTCWYLNKPRSIFHNSNACASGVGVPVSFLICLFSPPCRNLFLTISIA